MVMYSLQHRLRRDLKLGFHQFYWMIYHHYTLIVFALGSELILMMNSNLNLHDIYFVANLFVK